eukprot:CAMPEP_0171180528 /NCGR_PEP_ID=MMETSP0790-20130122/13801_1 /TAXON_ID=2925 /ORGANISM="Alexandrium catenella, Strain OF101" /LENGTH=342 /DNA_ID=CAMNT_0011645459 /DNA_START=45 /DNA_END=1069 /DNA_ORIENTATION=-
MEHSAARPAPMNAARLAPVLHRRHADLRQAHDNLPVRALALHRLDLEVLLHVLRREAKLPLQLVVLAGLHALLHVEGVSRRACAQLLRIGLRARGDVRDEGIVVGPHDIDGLHHLLDLLIVLVDDALLLCNLHLSDRVLEGGGKVDPHHLKPHGDHALGPERLIDLVQHPEGDVPAVLPELLGSELLRGVADHVAGEEQEPLPGTRIARQGEVDIEQLVGDKLELHGARDGNGLTSAVGVLGVGPRARGDGRVVGGVSGPHQRGLRGREGDVAPEGPDKVDASAHDVGADAATDEVLGEAVLVGAQARDAHGPDQDEGRTDTPAAPEEPLRLVAAAQRPEAG